MSAAPKKPEEKEARNFSKLKVNTIDAGHRRGGLAFGKDVTEVNVDDLDEDKLQAILNDPRLRVEKV